MKKSRKVPKVRGFVAIEFALFDQIKGLWHELNELAQDPKCKLRVIPPGNLHLTLKFLGSIPEDQLGAIASVASQVAAKHKAVQLSCRGIGLFRNSIWVGIDTDDALTALALELDQAFALLGFSPEQKAFAPHVTVARLDKDAKLKLSALIEKYKSKEWGTIEVRAIHLYRSDTLPEGARYSILESYPLIKED